MILFVFYSRDKMSGVTHGSFEHVSNHKHHACLCLLDVPSTMISFHISWWILPNSSFVEKNFFVLVLEGMLILGQGGGTLNIFPPAVYMQYLVCHCTVRIFRPSESILGMRECVSKAIERKHYCWQKYRVWICAISCSTLMCRYTRSNDAKRTIVFRMRSVMIDVSEKLFIERKVLCSQPSSCESIVTLLWQSSATTPSRGNAQIWEVLTYSNEDVWLKVIT